ncbi:hypothetical protein GCM10025857_20480 [Alicyclobacillus contaminans]|nr:hypothetical protein GCM10025857_20480 [Alicyclobacillus contaminans]
MFASGLVGAAVVLLGIAVNYGWHHFHQPPVQPTSGSNVAIQVVSSKPADTSQPTQQQNQVYATVQQMLHTAVPDSLDTSGFVQSVYAKVGIQLPRTIAEQAQTGTLVGSRSDLTTGDLVFFNLDNTGNTATFDGIYLGQNQFAAVTTHGLKVIDLSDTYWSGRFLYGRRVL